MNLAKRIPRLNTIIDSWMINATPDTMIILRQFNLVVDFNDIEAYFRRREEIVYEVSEEMFYYP